MVLLVYNVTSINWIQGIISNKDTANFYWLTWIKPYTFDKKVLTITGRVELLLMQIKTKKILSIAKPRLLLVNFKATSFFSHL